MIWIVDSSKSDDVFDEAVKDFPKNVEEIETFTFTDSETDDEEGIPLEYTGFSTHK